jgi:hypothetical protein
MSGVSAGFPRGVEMHIMPTTSGYIRIRQVEQREVVQSIGEVGSESGKRRRPFHSRCLAPRRLFFIECEPSRNSRAQ